MSSGWRSIASRLVPVIAPAIAMVMPLAQQAVMKPASPPVRRAITVLAARCRSSISTHCEAISAIAAIASGTMIEAPSVVIVPETLMIGRRPSRSRIGRLERSAE